MQLIVMGGGQGTRLQPLTNYRTKLEVKLLGQPLFWWSIFPLLDHVTSIIFLLGNNSDQLANEIREYFAEGAEIVHETISQGSGSALLAIKDRLDDLFLVVPGDIVYEFDQPLDLSLKDDSLGKIWLHRRQDCRELGICQLNEQHQITSFIEKPPIDASEEHLVNTGLLLLRKSILDHLPKNSGFQQLERLVFPRIATMRQLEGIVQTKMWFDLGTREGFLSAQHYQLELIDEPNCNLIDRQSECHNSSIDHSVVTGSRIENSRIENSTIFEGNDLKEVIIQNSIIDCRSTVPKGSLINNKIVSDSMP